MVVAVGISELVDSVSVTEASIISLLRITSAEVSNSILYSSSLSSPFVGLLPAISSAVITSIFSFLPSASPVATSVIFVSAVTSPLTGSGSRINLTSVQGPPVHVTLALAINV